MSSSSAGHNVHSDVKIWIEMIDCALSLWYFGWTPFEQNWNIIELLNGWWGSSRFAWFNWCFKGHLCICSTVEIKTLWSFTLRWLVSGSSMADSWSLLWKIPPFMSNNTATVSNNNAIVYNTNNTNTTTTASYHTNMSQLPPLSFLDSTTGFKNKIG